METTKPAGGGRDMRPGMRTAVFVAALSVVSFGVNVPAADASDPVEDGQAPHKHITYVEVDSDFTDANVAHMRTDGSHHRLLSARPGFDVSPEYSPYGRRIAFTSGRSAPAGSENDPRYSEAYVMNADGSHVRRITTNVGRLDLAPSWAPQGRRLVLGRGPAAVHGRTDLWIINLTAGRERRLTHSRGTTEEFPDWSPDGRRILFRATWPSPATLTSTPSGPTVLGFEDSRGARLSTRMPTSRRTGNRSCSAPTAPETPMCS